MKQHIIPIKIKKPVVDKVPSREELYQKLKQHSLFLQGIKTSRD